MLTYYVDAWKQYANFQGRATRPQFWWFYVINSLIIIVFTMINQSFPHNVIVILVRLLYLVAVLIPTLALSTRRLHDTNRSAWWLLLYFVPILGWIILLVFYALPSDPHRNTYDTPLRVI
ncbi:DUF805 domain-containing protein [Sulfobacillus thermosulfidooxidans]|uniref:DUF805 domain-containing protein n=1 Tax=Sulfobacillus thermosulfidooxidans TaxID=28034 RepID=UPI0006B5473A|nr:DUF805 domain-containing protein [Sulfobacillus thermosulfidooxidans]